ncbi:MAG TPA: glycosyltransferase family 39 protein [Anaerolineales bacterium]|nr:glycosyltransferase family 39 protein [Anaerolineales bacterium]
MSNQARYRLGFIFLLALLLVSQLSLASQRSFWEDEAATARLAALSAPEIIVERANNNHPPLYWLLVGLWGRFFGQDELGLRTFSILSLVGVLGLIYTLAGSLYSPRAGWLAGLLLVASPYVLTYGHNARYYAFAAALSLLALLAAYRYLEEHSVWALVVYMLAGTALIYTIYMGGTILVGINLWMLVETIRRKRSFRQYIVWLSIQVLVLLSYLPWLGYLSGVVGRNLDPAYSLAGLPSAITLRLGYLGFAYCVGEFFSPFHPLVWLGILVSLLLLISAVRRLDAITSLLVSVLVVAVLTSVIVSSLSVFPQSAWQNLSNRTFFVYPCFILLLAAGLDRLRVRRLQVGLALLLVVYLVGGVNVFTGRQAVKPLLIVPWVQVMEKIQIESRPGAIVFCSHFDTVCPYYVDRFGLPRASLGGWEQVLASQPPEVWWLQNNIGGYDYDRALEEAAFQALQAAYPQVKRLDYGAQDASIRSIKARWLGQEDYPYRLNVYHFSTAVP